MPLERNILARLAVFGETLQYRLNFIFTVWVRPVEGGEDVSGILTNDGEKNGYLYWFLRLVKLRDECIIAPGEVKSFSSLRHVSVVSSSPGGGGNVNPVVMDDCVLSHRCYHVTCSLVDVYLIEELNIN